MPERRYPLREGLLWYDDSDLDLRTKVMEAAERYEEKFGARPNRCYINPECLPDAALPLNGIKVVTSNAVLPNHFWVGAGSDPGEEKA
jgi:hypothetical protein